MGGVVRVEKEDGLGWLIFDHPERRNAVNGEMWASIPGLVADLEADPDVRVVILRGAGDVAFVSGADISEFEQTRMGVGARDYDASNAKAFAALAQLGKPVLAMIHGFCVGGGMAIALTADMRYSADDGRFGIPAARLGLGYGAGGIEVLRALVGPSAAKEILFTARRFRAEEALQMGLVNAVYPKAQLEEAVRETAATIAANAPLTQRSTKLIVGELSKPAGLRDDEAVGASIRACFESEDYKEGVRAFLEKRTPRFRGQ